MKKVVLISFTGIYDNEDFYKKYPHEIIDASDISETKYMLSTGAKEILKKRLEDVPVSSIHFLDSGDYHYVSLFFINRIDEDFVLIVFDHHKDAEKDELGDVITCGNWITHIKNPHLKFIIEIGPKDGRCGNLKSYSDISFLMASSMDEARILASIYPVYISLDKDILNKDVIRTDWDQGNFSEKSLLSSIDMVFKEDEVLGIDICGECENEFRYMRDIQKDDAVNEELLDFIENVENNIKM